VGTTRTVAIVPKLPVLRGVRASKVACFQAAIPLGSRGQIRVYAYSSVHGTIRRESQNGKERKFNGKCTNIVRESLFHFNL